MGPRDALNTRSLGRQFHLPGRSVFVREWGGREHETLFFWHGAGNTGHHVVELARCWVAEHGLHVLAPDAPGHGRSPDGPAEALLPSEVAALTRDLLAALAIERVVAVGYSWGGRIVCELAARDPNCVSAVVLIDGGYVDIADDPDEDPALPLAARIAAYREEDADFHFPSWREFLRWKRSRSPRWSPALARAFRPMAHVREGRIEMRVSSETAAALVDGLFREPLVQALRGLGRQRIPVLLLVSEQSADNDVRQAAIGRFRRTLPEADVRTLAGPHDLISAHGTQLATLIADWLRVVRPRA
jgi:pimeloyl-ACP methyl ester carboxylesterase